MAKVTLVFEDREGNARGDVSCTSTPPFADLASRLQSGRTLTNAEAYAVHAMLSVRDKSKQVGRRGQVIEIPKPKEIM